MNKYLSRKFLVTIVVSVLTVILPIIYSKSGISETVILAVLGILAGVGTGYGFINLKDSKNLKQDKEG